MAEQTIHHSQTLVDGADFLIAGTGAWSGSDDLSFTVRAQSIGPDVRLEIAKVLREGGDILTASHCAVRGDEVLATRPREGVQRAGPALDIAIAQVRDGANGNEAAREKRGASGVEHREGTRCAGMAGRDDAKRRSNVLDDIAIGERAIRDHDLRALHRARSE